jgi:LysM repeat protein
MKLLLAPFLLGLLALPATAEACQSGRTTVSGETVAEVAWRCGVNVEALRQLNPGLSDRTIRPGLIVAVPPPPLPSPQAGYGRPRVSAQPPLASGVPASKSGCPGSNRRPHRS